MTPGVPTSPRRFAAATSVAPAPSNNSTSTALDHTRYTAEVVDGWDIMGNANGGYVMALLGRAALAHTGRPDVVSMSANFLAPSTAGPLSIDVEEVRIGRRFATVRSTGYLGGESLVATSTVICGDLTAHDGPTMVSVSPPPMPAPLDCVRAEPTEFFPPPFVGSIDIRVHPDDAGGYHGEGSIHGEPKFRGWFRLLDDEPMDTLAVILAGDALPPPAFNTNLTVGWSPTVQLTIHVHARPNGQWLLIDQCSDIIEGGACETTATIFNPDGSVVARARQLQLLALT